MPTFEIKTKIKLMIDGSFVDKGLTVQVSTFASNPFNEPEKIQNAYMRVYGLDFKKGGYLNMGHFDYKQI